MTQTKTNTTQTNNTTKKISNWGAYNNSLKQRGNITLLIDEAMASSAFRKPLPTHEAGHPFTYADSLILLILSLRTLLHQPLRQITGFMEGILRGMGIDWTVPDYTTLSRRAGDLDVPLLTHNRYMGNDEPLVLLLDSSGFKIYGEGEWKVRKHGVGKRRTWRETHIAVDHSTRDIVSLVSTKPMVGDSTQVLPLLIAAENNLQKIDSARTLKDIIGDGAYDSNELYHLADNLGATLIAPPKKNADVHAKMRHHCIYEDEDWLKRNAVVKRCWSVGIDEWKRETGYHRRSLVENTYYRLKTIFGDRLRSRTIKNQHTESMIRARSINKFNKMGLPKYVPI